MQFHRHDTYITKKKKRRKEKAHWCCKTDNIAIHVLKAP